MEKLNCENREKHQIDGFHVLIAAGGRGTRFTHASVQKLPKQYNEIGKKSLLRHTIDVFLQVPGLVSLRVIINPEHADLYQKAVMGLDLPPPVHGGKDRINSIYNGLRCFSNLKSQDKILIHDAVRPLIEPADIEKVVAALDDHEAVCPALAVTDTLRKEDGKAIERDGLYALQTPQGFHFGTILEAHERAGSNTTYTDDTGLVAALGVPVKLLPGSRRNLKITTPDDFEMAAALLGDSEVRTGTGFDVHAFAGPEDSDGQVILCGIKVPFEKSLTGHSDADVGLHAITDAILGSISAGDIGHHFPPSNDNFKDMDSATFLNRAVEILAEKGGSLVNLDVTLICEDPKVGPHRVAMQNRIAEIAGIEPQRVSVKATTTEKLGITGRGEGIAAQAIATVRLPRG